VLVGGMCLTGRGVLVAARPRTIEGVSGLMNLVLLPMWLLGGSFFDTDHFQGILHWAAEAMPLTHVNRAMRDCMLEASGFDVALLPLLVLAGSGSVCFLVALRIFRWT
jgi:ABC-2 type transport system permease protein